MPTYEYHCDACGHDFEKFQSMSSDPVKVCPECGRKKVRRLIGTGAGLIFKGSGFYITDYRDKGYADKAKADAGDAKPAEAKPTEAKPTEAKPTDPKPAAPATAAQTKPAAVAEAPKAAPKKDKKK